jgi:hypothetical protein
MSDSYDEYHAQQRMPAEIATAVLEVMAEVGYVQKTGTNSFQNYKYASIEGVLEKVQPALVKAGLLITQTEVGHTITAEDNLMEATYSFSLFHKSGAEARPIKITSLSALRNSKGGYDDKALNKCNTAARKYFILGLFQIPTGLESDADEEEDKPSQPKSQAPIYNNGPKTAAPNGKSGKTTTADWAGAQMEKVNTFKTAAELKAWKSENQSLLDALATKDPKASNVLDDLINDRLDRMSVLQAG